LPIARLRDTCTSRSGCDRVQPGLAAAPSIRTRVTAADFTTPTGADFTIVCRGAGGRPAPGKEEIMSMDRLRRVLAGGALAMTLVATVASSGCRSTRNEVPPGPKYGMAGEPSSSGGFNSTPHPYNGIASPYGGNASTPGQPAMGGAPALGGGAT